MIHIKIKLFYVICIAINAYISGYILARYWINAQRNDDKAKAIILSLLALPFAVEFFVGLYAIALLKGIYDRTWFHYWIQWLRTRHQFIKGKKEISLSIEEINAVRISPYIKRQPWPLNKYYNNFFDNAIKQKS